MNKVLGSLGISRLFYAIAGCNAVSVYNIAPGYGYGGRRKGRGHGVSPKPPW